MHVFVLGPCIKVNADENANEMKYEEELFQIALKKKRQSDILEKINKSTA